jgi:hypothetical protein
VLGIAEVPDGGPLELKLGLAGDTVVAWFLQGQRRCVQGTEGGHQQGRCRSRGWLSAGWRKWPLQQPTCRHAANSPLIQAIAIGM